MTDYTAIVETAVDVVTDFGPATAAVAVAVVDVVETDPATVAAVVE